MAQPTLLPAEVSIKSKTSPERRILAQLLYAIDLKLCTKCNLVKPPIEFNVNSASPDGRAWKCKACSRARSKKFRELHPGAFQKWASTQRERLAQSRKEWRNRNGERRRESFRAWSRNNRDKINAKDARRNATIRSAMPPWANKDSIRAVYTEAYRLRKETGLPYQVDHIVPLQSSIVCGLHWEGNLQIILKHENISKLNRRWPGMPSD